MDFDLYEISYLAKGSPRQQRAYLALQEAKVFARLAADVGQVALVGSLPIDLALDESDIDLVTSMDDLRAAAARDRELFGAFEQFQSSRGVGLGGQFLLTKFKHSGESFEVFTQSTPIPRQNAVIHLMVEARLLRLAGRAFRERIMRAREAGLKTEPAFGACLGLVDPLRELLALEDLSDQELRFRFAEKLA